MSKAKYMQIDITVFCIICIFSEIMGYVLLNFLNSGYYISLSVFITIIIMVRWGTIGLIGHVLAGIPMIYIQGMPIEQGILFHVIANAFVGVPSLFLINKNRDVLVKSKFKFVLYVISVFVSLSIGKGTAILIIDHNLVGSLEHFLSMSFTLVISLMLGVAFLGRGDLICDMDEYLIRINNSNEEE